MTVDVKKRYQNVRVDLSQFVKDIHQDGEQKVLQKQIEIETLKMKNAKLEDKLDDKRRGLHLAQKQVHLLNLCVHLILIDLSLCVQVIWYRKMATKIRGRFGTVQRMSVKPIVSRTTLWRADKEMKLMMERMYGGKEGMHSAFLRSMENDDELDKRITDKKFVESVESINKGIRALELCPIAVNMTMCFSTYVNLLYIYIFYADFTGVV